MSYVPFMLNALASRMHIQRTNIYLVDRILYFA